MTTFLNNRNADRQTGLQKRLQDPVQLRMFLTGFVLLLGYGCVYIPLSDAIAKESRQLVAEQQRNQLTIDITRLERQQATFAKRLPTSADSNEWMQYILGGIRKWPVQLHSLDPKPSRRIGPYQIAEFSVELEGAFTNLSAFVHWIESNDRLLRIDHIKITPSRADETRLVLNLTVLAMNG